MSQPAVEQPAISVADAVRRVLAVERGRAFRVEGLRGGSRAFLVAEAQRTRPSTTLVVTATAADAEAFAGDLALFLGESAATPALDRRVHLFPAWDVAAFEPVSPSAAVVADRIATLFYPVEGRDPIVVTTPDAVLQRVLPPSILKSAVRYLVEGDRLDVDELAEHLTSWGYQRVPLVEDRGEFSVRGGLIDVFPLLEAEPVRVELDFDRIESIRGFDPDTQRSRDKREDVVILPAREISLAHLRAPEARRAVETRAVDVGMPRLDRHAMSDALENGLFFPGVEFVAPYVYQDGLATLFEYLGGTARLWIDDPAATDAGWEAAWDAIVERAHEAEAAPRFFAPPERFAASPHDARAALTPLATVELDPLIGIAGAPARVQLPAYVLTDFAAARVPQAAPTMKPVADKIREWNGAGRRVFLIVPGAGQRTRLAGLLAQHDLAVPISEQPLPQLLRSRELQNVIVDGALSQGFRFAHDPLVFVGEEELFGERRQQRRTRKVSAADVLSSLAELKADDYVVHVDHGIGLYRGLKHLTVAGTEGDYLHLEYLGGDRLYLPVDRINLVQKYVAGGEGAKPALDKLGGTSWEKVKAKTKEALLSMARELVEIGAKRQ